MKIREARFKLRTTVLNGISNLPEGTPHSSPSECDLIWLEGLYRDNQVKMKYY